MARKNNMQMRLSDEEYNAIKKVAGELHLPMTTACRVVMMDMATQGYCILPSKPSVGRLEYAVSASLAEDVMGGSE